MNNAKKNKKPVIALDIGEGAVKVLAVEQNDKDKGKGIIAGQGLSYYAPEGIIGSAMMDFSQVLAGCKDALGKAYKREESTKLDAVIGISGSISRTAVANIIYKRPRPEKEITEDELKNIIKEVKESVLRKTRKEFISVSRQDDFNLLNIAITEIRIDGYKVSVPLGFQGKEMNFRIVTVYAPVSYLKVIDALAIDLQLNVLSIFSLPFAMAKIYQNIKNGFGGIIIDVGYETTTVSVVQDNAMAGIKAFSIGGAAFTRAVARGLNIDYKAAEDAKIKYSLKKLSAELDGKISQIFSNIVLLWYRGVKKSLLDFSVTELVSGKIYITGGGSVLPEILRVLNTGDLRRNLPIIEMICVNQLNPLEEAGNIFNDNYIDPAEYSGVISLASFFLNYFNDKQNMDRFLLEEIRNKEQQEF